MRAFNVLIGAITLTAIGVMPAAAQEPGKVGLTMTSGSSVGLTIQASNRVAVRPEVAFSRTTFESTTPGSEQTTTSWSPGVSLLFTVKSWDSTRLYLSPQWTYSRLTSAAPATNSESKSSGHTVSGMLGAQHNITNRFAVFGEVGIGRSSQTTEGQLSTATARLWSTRSRVGAILFF